MDANSQQMLNQVQQGVAEADMLKAASDAASSVLLIGAIIGRDGNTVHIAVGNGYVYSIPIAGVRSIRALQKDEQVSFSVPSGTEAAVTVAKDTKIRLQKELVVGVDVVNPIPQVNAACPPQCKDPKQCGAGCCCDGKVCRGRSCVDP